MRRALMLPGLLAATTLALVACGGDGGGGSTPAGASCVLVGEPLALPHSRDFDVAATDGGFLLLTTDDQGAASYVIDAAGLGARVEAPLGSTGTLVGAANADRTRVFAISAGIGFGSNGVRVATWSGGAWTTASSAPLNPAALSPKGLSMTENSDGDLVVTFADGISTLRYRELLFDGTTFGDAIEILAGVEGLDGGEIHTANVAGGVLMTTLGRVDGELQILETTRATDGTWATPTVVGPVPASLSNITVSGLATSDTGEAWVVEARDSDLQTGTTGQVTFYRLDGAAGARRVDKVEDDRFVVEGVDAATLADGRLVATASWGSNNLDPAQSDDSVEMYVCTVDGDCGERLTLDGRNGIFYERTALATEGVEGVVVWSWEKKGQGATVDGLTAQRFRCDE